jgi:hypothetical protein
MIIHTFHPRLSLHFTSHHFTSHHFTSLHITSLHLTSLHFISHQFISPHFTTLYSPFFTSVHFPTFRQQRSKTLHFSSPIITPLTLFLKICDLQQKVVSASAGSWFHSLIVLFTKHCLPISVLCFLVLILRS